MSICQTLKQAVRSNCFEHASVRAHDELQWKFQTNPFSSHSVQLSKGGKHKQTSNQPLKCYWLELDTINMTLQTNNDLVKTNDIILQELRNMFVND